jgi:hypothetical protein
MTRTKPATASDIGHNREQAGLEAGFFQTRLGRPDLMG